MNELRNHKNAPSRLTSKRAKLTTNNNDTSSFDDEKSFLLENATQILDSKVLKKTPSNCIIDLCPIIHTATTTTTSPSSSDENDNLNISQNYQQNFQMINKPYDIQNYLNKKYFNQNYYNHPSSSTSTTTSITPTNTGIDPQQQWTTIVQPTILYQDYNQQQLQYQPQQFLTNNDYYNNYQQQQQQPIYNNYNDYNNYSTSSLYHQS